MKDVVVFHPSSLVLEQVVERRMDWESSLDTGKLRAERERKFVLVDFSKER